MALYYHDAHTFYGESNGCELDQIKHSLSQTFAAIDAANKVSSTEVRYYINFLKEKRRFYIYVVSSDDALALRGKKEVNTKTPEEMAKATEKPVMDGDNWADIMDEADDIKRKVTVDFPLILSGVVYVEGDANERTWKRFVKPGEVAIMRARASDVFEGMLDYILYLTFTGTKPPLEAVRQIASHYSSSPSPVQVKPCNNGYEVIFDRITKDGVFALFMLNGASLKGGETIVKATYARAHR